MLEVLNLIVNESKHLFWGKEQTSSCVTYPIKILLGSHGACDGRCKSDNALLLCNRLTGGLGKCSTKHGYLTDLKDSNII